MLSRLVIHDVVLIDKLTVSFARGLNVLSGETGAGKSILLDALALALGARSDASLIRAGAEKASVTATFDGRPPEPLRELFEINALSFDDEIILRRVIGKEGKSRAFINDQPIGVTLLRQIGQTLLEVHGQFETYGLLNPATHRGLLDAFAGNGKMVWEVKRAYEDWRQSLEAHDIAKAERHRALAEEEFLRAAVSELDDLSPMEGELDQLTEKRTQLQNREKIIETIQSAEGFLSGERGALSALNQAGKTLARMAEKDHGLNEILEIVDRAASEAEEASQAIAHYAHEIDADPHALEKIEDRFFKIRGVARKHNIQAAELSSLHETLRARLDTLCDQGDKLAKLAKNVMQKRVAYVEKAEMLSLGRKKAAAQLFTGVAHELPPLKFERAVFSVQIQDMPEDQWNCEGMDKIAFLAATNPGAAPAPLNKVASGGELSRFMLALKVVLAKADPVPTLVFDEVDAGIGGRAASAVGERLSKLGEDVQVLVVTHSPQVAARANHHLHVEKSVKGNKASTNIRELSYEDRIEELARMLAGNETTDAARYAALSLLKDAEPAPAKTKKGNRHEQKS